MQPEAALSPLPKADGSATYSYGGYSVTASANGPIEAQRRDENPYEALVDIVVRPASGVGGTRERHLESLLQQALRQILLVKQYPRCLIQIVLQITAAPANEYVNTKLIQPTADLSIIPALLQTAVLALLSAAVPMRATATCTAVAVVTDGQKSNIVVDPSPRQTDLARSVHALAFTSHQELVLAESTGDFSLTEWEQIYQTARSICCAPARQDIDMVLDDDDQQRSGPDLPRFLRSAAEAKTMADLHWK